MGRSYAGILGTLAGTLVLCRGAISGSGLETTMLVACAALFGFGAIGFIAGTLAESFTAEGVRQKFRLALEEQQQQRQRAAGSAVK
jgi:hypothetical protein